jgi:three-Cys-motif partner protein
MGNISLLILIFCPRYYENEEPLREIFPCCQESQMVLQISRDEESMEMAAEQLANLLLKQLCLECRYEGRSKGASIRDCNQQKSFVYTTSALWDNTKKDFIFNTVSKITSTTWPMEPHTAAKHEILRKYLAAWLPIITRWNGRVLYIDGFAGPGEYTEKDGSRKDGSPIIAINTVLQHKTNIASEIRMLFIESDPQRCAYLIQKIKTISLPANIKVECICAKFDETLTGLLNYIEEQKRRLAPALVFIDPFGFTGIPFNLVKRIMENQRCEVLITFMYEEINRFISDPKLWGSLKDTFGTDKWKEVISEKDSVKREEILRGIYKKQLEQEAGIKHVQSFKMLNKVKKTDYFLFFGTNNITGLKKMKEAMWKVDKVGSFQFSDATFNPSQPMLFKPEPNYSWLKQIILKEFKGKSVSTKELENFVLTQTPFRETHFKRQILTEMEKADPPEIKVECQDPRKRGTFTDQCIIKFF